MQIAALCPWGVALGFPPEAASLLNSFKVLFVIKWGILYHCNELTQHGSINISYFPTAAAGFASEKKRILLLMCTLEMQIYPIKKVGEFLRPLF